jgi:hypothetical protein
MGPPDCTCNSQEEQWATAIELIRDTSRCFVEARDTKACWDLLAKLFELPFFDLLKLTAPYTLQVRQGREASNKNRLTPDLPEEAQQELRKCEETLKVHSELVDSHKAAVKLAAKRKLLIYSEAEFAEKEAKLERERKALNIKRRRTEAEAVQLNTATDRHEIPRAHAGVSGFTRQIPADPLVTARRDLINRAYVKDLQPPKVRQGLVSAGTNPSKGKQLAAPVGISLLLKQVSIELSAITGLDVEDVPGSRAPPFNQMENFETGNEMENVRDQRYHSRRKRKEFASFMHEVVRRFPLSSTRNAILTKEERNRSFILEHIPEAVLASRVYFFVNIFGTLRDFSMSKPNRRRKHRGTSTVIVEFESAEDGARFLKECGARQVYMFQARRITDAVDVFPRHHKGNVRKYLE